MERGEGGSERVAAGGVTRERLRVRLARVAHLKSKEMEGSFHSVCTLVVIGGPQSGGPQVILRYHSGGTHYSGDIKVEVIHLYFCFWKTFTVGCGEQEEGDNCQCPDLDLLFSLLLFLFLINLEKTR